MSEITYRPLRLDEAARIREIDASQFVGRAWRDVNGVKRLVEINYQDPDFPNGFENHLDAIRKTITSGGSALGAWQGERLIGFCTVNTEFYGFKYKYVLLDQIFISLPNRSKGIGKQLFIRAAADAVKFGAEKLYICAGSSEETIAFYKALGCVEAIEINAELYEGDTRDIQLEYSL